MEECIGVTACYYNLLYIHSQLVDQTPSNNTLGELDRSLL